jgi:hypothetical protein
VRAARTPRQAIRGAADKLRQACSGPLGLVLNAVTREGHADRYDYYYYERSGETEPAAPMPRPKRAASRGA